MLQNSVSFCTGVKCGCGWAGERDGIIIFSGKDPIPPLTPAPAFSTMGRKISTYQEERWIGKIFLKFETVREVSFTVGQHYCRRCRLCWYFRAGIVWAEPDQQAVPIWVDSLKLIYILSSLAEIILVDAPGLPVKKEMHPECGASWM